MPAGPDPSPPPAALTAAILSGIEFGICTADPALTITYANRAAALICQRRSEDLIGLRLEDAIPGFDSAARREFEDALQQRSPRRIERQIGAPPRCLEIGIHPDAAGLWLHLHYANTDRLLEQQLRERDEILTMAERSAGIGVWDIDLAAGTVRGTPQFWRVMGLPPTDEALPIETTRRLRLPGDRERVARGFEGVLGNHAESYEVEYRIRRPDGEVRWIYGRSRLVRDSQGRPVRHSGIDIDVTERKAGEAALADLNSELEKRISERTAALETEIVRRAEAEARLHHAHKMETIGQLTGGIAHDFNNLLTVISGNIEALERGLPQGEQRLRRFAEAAIRGTERAATLTHRLLSFARRQPLEPKLIDVNRLILGMSDLLHRTLGEAITIEMRLADDLAPVFADPSQMENAILNLAVNSRDAMPDGGTLAIETGDTILAEPAIPGDLTAPTGTCAVITIRDSGSGMPQHVKEKAFEPFFTTKEAGHGTGLGLAQVHAFVTQLGGLCQLDSEPRSGTTIRLYLPNARVQASQQIQAEAHQTPLIRGSGETILVTEDDADVRAYGVELLRELGYQVLDAAEAGAALRALEANASIRLLFADVGLPGPLDGRQLAEAAINRFPGLRVLLTTGHVSESLLTGRPGSEIALIMKPFTAAALAAKVRQVLHS